MSNAIRLTKLRFIVDEMQLALYLTKHAPDDFTARMLARHVIVRAENFISHARGLRRPLRSAGFDVRQFHTMKETYAEYFDEYFHAARDRLGAHVQDSDFGKRIELWNDIEIGKVDFFVQGAVEIYKLLDSMSIPGCPPFAEPAELSNSELAAILLAFKGSAPVRQGAEIGVDPLAMTRPGTSAMLNTTPVHARASQLALIKRWMISQRGLLDRLTGYEAVARIVRARIVTDIVSFCDCLITRPVPSGAPQEMDGLDNLIVATGHTSTVVQTFRRNVEWEMPLAAARGIRDKIGAHVESEASVTLLELIHAIDIFDLKSCSEFYDTLTRLFEKVCRSVVFLKVYVADGVRLNGVILNGGDTVSFDPRETKEPVDPSQFPPPSFSFEEHGKYLTDWIGGEALACQTAQHYFYQAFLNSPVVEQYTDEEDLNGVGTRYIRRELKKAHQFILDVLLGERSDVRFGRTLQLILASGHGDPDLTCEVLVRFNRARPGICLSAFAFCFGELASWPNGNVKKFLSDIVNETKDWQSRFHAMVALFKIFLRSEGLTRINRKIEVLTYAGEIEPLLRGLTKEKMLQTMLVFSSQFCGQRLGHFHRQFLSEYDGLKAMVLTLSNEVLGQEAYTSVSDVMSKLVGAHDYVGITVVISDQLRAAGKADLASDLIAAACNGDVIAPANDQGARNLACCFLRREDFDTACGMAIGIAERNPDDIGHQLFAAQVLSVSPEVVDKAIAAIARIRSCYKLDADQEQFLVSLEKHIADQSSSKAG